MLMTDEDLRAHMLDSLIELMNEARLEKDALMFESYARLVHETWTAIMDGEETC
jgi:predicted GNAT superfamily acetyltransferase